jgi:site-specific DNA-methyltransferase (adenine-specific)
MLTQDPKSSFNLHRGDVLEAYATWPKPKTIVSDGAYGVGGFPGDPRTASELPEWYASHIEAWSSAANLDTTLWFWNTELGWATIHPILVANGWKFETLNVWNKGVAHVAGNVNGNTIRRFPVVTEVCAFYTREPLVKIPGTTQVLHMKQWLRDEWQRTGLPFKAANEACGVKDAATRKYFDQGWLWYWPPTDVMMRLVAHANTFGEANGRPYFSFDGIRPVSSEEWAKSRSTWNHEHGVTNVWDRPALRGNERLTGSMNKAAPRQKTVGKSSANHLNQKPLDLMERIIKASTNIGDVVWEPFGGLATASIASVELKRIPYLAEINDEFYEMALNRLLRYAKN